MKFLLFVLLGVVGGIFGGFFGIGGGIILIPVLVYVVGLTQHQAQGTALAAILPPVGLFAVLRYYYGGNVNLKMALFIALGFFLGAFLGAEAVHLISSALLKRMFGVFLLIVSLNMIFF